MRSRPPPQAGYSGGLGHGALAGVLAAGGLGRLVFAALLVRLEIDSLTEEGRHLPGGQMVGECFDLMLRNPDGDQALGPGDRDVPAA